MRTLGRIIFLLLSIVTGFWAALGLVRVFASFQNPDAVPEALGGATVPVLFFIVCVWFFRGLARPRPAEPREPQEPPPL